jgi:Flp pilus assembly protein TadG
MEARKRLRNRNLDSSWHAYWRGLHAAVDEDCGTNLLEMALLTPFLLLLLLGIIEVGRYAELSIQVANAARAGVQYGAQNLVTAADITGIENAAANDGQSVPGLQVSPPSDGYSAGYVLCGCSGGSTIPSATCPATCTAPSHQVVYVQVNTKGVFGSLFNYPGLPSSLTVTGKAQMQVAQ